MVERFDDPDGLRSGQVFELNRCARRVAVDVPIDLIGSTTGGRRAGPSRAAFDGVAEFIDLALGKDVLADEEAVFRVGAPLVCTQAKARIANARSAPSRGHRQLDAIARAQRTDRDLSSTRPKNRIRNRVQ